MTAHTLKAKGAAFSPTNLTLVDKDGGTSGIGVGVCSCGQVSPILPTGRRRKAWHAEHKAEMEASAAIDPIVEQLETTGHVEIEDGVVQPVADGHHFENGRIRFDDGCEPETLEEDEDGAPLPPGDGEMTTVTKEWKGNYSIVFVPMTVELADAYELLVTRTENVSAVLRKVHITGRAPRVAAFMEVLEDVSSSALAHLKEWQKAHQAERKGLTDMQKFLQHREVLAAFGHRAAEELRQTR